MRSDLTEVREIIGNIEGEMPSTIISKIRDACCELYKEGNIELNIDKTIQKLGEISEDPRVDTYSKTIIWNILSKLESNV